LKVLFHQSAFADYQLWATEDIVIFQKISSLIKEITRTPFVGRGKPEPLHGDLSGFWSRRITGKHRFVYKVEREQIVIASCKSHYGDR